MKAPWPNPVEPKRADGERAAAEADRKLSAAGPRQRACDYYGRKPGPLLAKPAI